MTRSSTARKGKRLSPTETPESPAAAVADEHGHRPPKLYVTYAWETSEAIGFGNTVLTGAYALRTQGDLEAVMINVIQRRQAEGKPPADVITILNWRYLEG